MLLSTLDELRLFSPSNAIDNFDSLAGFLSSSEHDFLEEKLGTPLYTALITYYAANIKPDPTEYITTIAEALNDNPYAHLLYLAQKAVTYDALSRAVNLQAISVNGAGVNVASADDYKAADASTIADYKKACVKEAHSAINELLATLERWTIEVSVVADGESPNSEKKEIADLWRNSRYFYLAASLLIPSAKILQEYYNIYDSREKFIQLLPDLQYIQEDLLAPIFGDDFIEYMAAWATSHNSHNSHNSQSSHNSHVSQGSEGSEAPLGSAAQSSTPALEPRFLHTLRKITARHLEARLLKPTDPRKESAYNEAIKLTQRLSDALQVRQPDMSPELQAAFLTSPLYEVPKTDNSPTPPTFENNADGNVIFVTPGLV